MPCCINKERVTPQSDFRDVDLVFQPSPVVVLRHLTVAIVKAADGIPSKLDSNQCRSGWKRMRSGGWLEIMEWKSRKEMFRRKMRQRLKVGLRGKEERREERSVARAEKGEWVC